MSWDIRAKFCLRNQLTNTLDVVLDTFLPELKVLSSVNYSVMFDDTITEINVSDTDKKLILTEPDIEYFGPVDKTIQLTIDNEQYNLINIVEKQSNASNLYLLNCSNFSKESIEKIKSQLNSKSLCLTNPNNIYLNIQIPKTIDNDHWFDKSSFNLAIEKYTNELDKLLVRRYKLKSMSESIEFYQLTTKQKMSVMDEINTLSEFIDEQKYKINACNSIVNSINLFENQINLKDYSDSKCIVCLSAC